MLRWSILPCLALATVACGSSSDQNTGGGGGQGGGAADTPPCDRVPKDGTRCSPDGRACQTAGSPCGSVHTCQGGAWESKAVCPPVQGCPESRPVQGDACRVENPVVGLSCSYNSDCGDVRAVCSDTRWELEANSVTECSALCEGLCQRLDDCGIAWVRDCPAQGKHRVRMQRSATVKAPAFRRSAASSYAAQLS